jgi:L-cysteine desulfidase
VFDRDITVTQDSRDINLRHYLKVKDIFSFCKEADVKILGSIIEPQIRLNSAICEEGLQHQWGASVGRNILMHQPSNIISRAKAVTAAGSDARMSGCDMPVVINSGSGNQGLTVSMPVVEFAKAHLIENERLIRALTFSNLVAIRQKVKIGRLSAYCGAVNAATGAGAAITWLSGGDLGQIERSITNTLATISGMVCDGAKPSCAAKISVAIEAAFLGHALAMDQGGFDSGDGLVGETVEDTIDNIGTLASEGMEYTDEVIVSLMVDKNRVRKNSAPE